jgi:hypothetical protein
MPAEGWNVPQDELETLARAIGLPAVPGSWPAARHKARVAQFQTLLDGGRPDGWDGSDIGAGAAASGAGRAPAGRSAAAAAAAHAEDGEDEDEDEDEDDEEDTARCKQMFGMASQRPSWSSSQQSASSLDEHLSATQPFEDSQSYSQGYSQDDEDEDGTAGSQRLSQASNADTLPYEMSQSLSQRLSDVEDDDDDDDDDDDEDDDDGAGSPILGDDVSDDDELFGAVVSQSLSPSPPPHPPRIPTPIPGGSASSPPVCRLGSDTPSSAPATSSPPGSADAGDGAESLPTPAQRLRRKDSAGAKAATAALGPRGPFALAAAAAMRARSRSGSRSPSLGAGGSPPPPVVRKTPLFAPFIYKNDHFTKTGSGQT